MAIQFEPRMENPFNASAIYNLVNILSVLLIEHLAVKLEMFRDDRGHLCVFKVNTVVSLSVMSIKRNL